MSDARDLYREFRGRSPARTGKIGIRFGTRWLTAPGSSNLLIPESLAIIGHVSAIEYETTRDGRYVPPRHEFSQGSRPLLAVGSRRGEVFLVGNRFIFTDRGIMDIDAHGRLIDDHPGLTRR